MKCPRCQQDNPSHAEFCLKCGAPIDGRTPIPNSYADLKGENEELRRSLAEALQSEAEAQQQQTATAEVLRIISTSPTDLQPVLDAVVERAARLCVANDAVIFRDDGDTLTPVATCGVPAVSSVPRTRGTASGRAIVDRQPVHVEDLASPTSIAEFPDANVPRARGIRTQLAVPLLREGEAVGVILIRRFHVQPFTEQQIALLKTFADQAVIAIENVRLFKELEQRNTALTEALEQQTATSQILRVISSSPTDVQPVLDAVVRSAARLCEAYDAWLGLREGEHLRIRVHHGPIAIAGSELRPMHRGRVATNAILDRRTIHAHDLAAAGAEFPVGQDDAVRAGHRTTLGVPLMREGQAIGVILIRRVEVRPFTDSQVTLLETFADQAVIAIENVRLFTELEEKNRALTAAHAQVTEALEQQTATSEILRVISSSPTDLQPVMDAVAENAARLCDASDAQILRADGETITLVASFGRLPTITTEPRKISRRLVGGRAIIDRVTLHIPDVRVAQDEFPDSATVPLGVRTVLATPLLREGVDWRHHDSPDGGSTVLGEAGQAPPDLRRSGGNRHRECAVVHRTAGEESHSHRGP